MKLEEIKTDLEIAQLNLNRAEKDGKPTEWFRHWDNDNRVAVSIHQDTVKALQNTPNMDNLGIQKETRTGEKGEYLAIRIVAFTPAEVVL